MTVPENIDNFIYIYRIDDQLYMAVCFCYLLNRDFPVYATVQYKVAYTADKQLFTRYQNNTAMFIWSGCTVYKDIWWFVTW